MALSESRLGSMMLASSLLTLCALPIGIDAAPSDRPASPQLRQDGATKAKTRKSPVPVADERGFIPVGLHGTVKLHPKRMEVEAQGILNLRYGFVEFLACAPEVKPHETLVSLGCDPRDLKLALLLLGVDDEKARRPENDGDLRPIPGDRLMIFLRWKTTGEDGKVTVHEKRAEDCIFNSLVEESMERCGFVFTGSTFVEEHPEFPFEDPWEKKAEGEADDANKKDDAGEGDGAGDKKDLDPTQPPKPPKQLFAPLVVGQYIALCHRPYVLLDNPLALPFPDGAYYADQEVLPEFEPEDPPAVTMIFRRPKEGEIDYTVKGMKIPPRPPEDEDDADSDDDSEEGDSDDKN